MKLLIFLFTALVPVFSASAETLVVLNKAEATASLIDLATGKVTATIPTGEGPHEVAVTNDGSKALVTNYGTRNAPGSSLTLIDIPAAKAIKTISLGENKGPHGVQWFRNGKDAAVTVERNKAILIVDTEAGSILKVIKTDRETSHMLVLSPDENRAYVANIGSGGISALDLRVGKKIADIRTGAGAEGIALTPDGKYLWVTNREADSVSVIRTGSLTVIQTIPSKSFPIRARITPDGKNVLITHAKTGDVAVFDAATRKELRRISIPLESVSTGDRLMEEFGKSSVPIGILIHPSGEKAFVAHANADVITVLDLKEWKISGQLKAGKEPDGLGFSNK